MTNPTKTFNIAIVGPPGVGKTTLAAGLFFNFKKLGKHVEFIPELIKTKVFEGADFSQDGFDVSNTLKQKQFEDIFRKAKHKIDFLITEGPLCNGYFYSSFYKKELEAPILKKIAKDNINSYDVILFVERIDSAKYVKFGRKESLEEAKQLEKHIKKSLKDLGFKNELIVVNQKTPIEEILPKIIKE